MAEEVEEGEWVQVDRRRKNKERIASGSSGITKFYVGNLPDVVCNRDLEDCFREFGTVVGSYVARRRDKNNKRFGFVSFKGVGDKGRLESRLKYVKLGDRPLKVNVAMFSYENGGYTPPLRASSGGKKPVKVVPTDGFRKPRYQREQGRSFRDVVLNKNNEECKDSVLRLPADIAGNFGEDGCELIGKVVSFESLKDMKIILKDLGYLRTSIRYVGGLYILIKFDCKERANSFIGSYQKGNLWFSFLEVWGGQIVKFERIAWLKIHGVPLRLMVDVTFNCIGNKYGTVVHPAIISTSLGNLAEIRIGVLVESGSKIEDEFQLIHGYDSFNIWVVEDGGSWLPECAVSEGLVDWDVGGGEDAAFVEEAGKAIGREVSVDDSGKSSSGEEEVDGGENPKVGGINEGVGFK